MKPGSVTLGRAPITGRRGAVAAGHPVAAEIGVGALRSGGTAIDAAIAAGFASFAVEPKMCGIGGHGRMAVYLADRGLSVGIDHFIRAPRAATPDMYQSALARWREAGRGGTEGAINTTGHLSVGIPGAVAGLWEAHRRFGRLPWRDLVGPAIELARSGFAVDGFTTLSIAARAVEIRDYPAAARMLLPDGVPPRPPTPNGPQHVLDFTDMARMLTRIADQGAAAFYEGDFAVAVEREMRANGGLLTSADLAAYRADVFELPRYSYRNWRYTTCGDLIFVECLNILEHFDLADLDHEGAAGCHVVAEALAQAFVDNFSYAADQKHRDAPLDGLASKAFAHALAGRIDLDRAQTAITAGDPWPHQPGTRGAAAPAFAGTTQIVAADADGNMASLITSLGSSFGSLVLVPDTSVFLGNAMQWFDPRPGRANSVAPGVMPLYAAPVVIVFDGETAIGAIAGSGGYRIQTAILHAFINRLDRGLHPQAAIDAPRLHAQGDEVDIDSRFPGHVLDRLRELGHRLRVLDGADLAGGFGRPSAVWRNEDGLLIPASDALAGGVAVLL